jgi:hypothetical protein
MRPFFESICPKALVNPHGARTGPLHHTIGRRRHETDHYATQLAHRYPRILAGKFLKSPTRAADLLRRAPLHQLVEVHALGPYTLNDKMRRRAPLRGSSTRRSIEHTCGTALAQPLVEWPPPWRCPFGGGAVRPARSGCLARKASTSVAEPKQSMRSARCERAILVRRVMATLRRMVEREITLSHHCNHHQSLMSHRRSRALLRHLAAVKPADVDAQEARAAPSTWL